MQTSLPFTYQIRESERATKARIIVTSDKIEVVAPQGISKINLDRFVFEQREWIMNAQLKMQRKRLTRKKLSPDIYHSGVPIPYLGTTYTLAIKPSTLKKIKIEFAEEFIAHIPQSIQFPNTSDAIKQAISTWMKRQLKHKVEQIVEHHGPKKSLFPRNITIKSQKSRWGSCGIHNDITINWLLILAPVTVIEYVVVHELCHIKFKNHSSDFWNLVALHLPCFQEHRRWLKTHGASLMAGL